MAVTPNTGAPLFEAGQALPEFTINQAILVLDDILVNGIQSGSEAIRPPASDWPGSLWATTEAPRTLYQSDGVDWISLIVEGGEGGGGGGAHGHTTSGDGGLLARPRVTVGVVLTMQSGVPTPAPPINSVLLYFGADGILYKMDSGGSVNPVGGGGVGGGTATSTTFSPAGGIGATNVQSAIEEAYSESARTTHTHNGTEVSNTPSGTIGATTVQGAINELESEKAAAAHSHPATGITFSPAGNISSGNVQSAIAELDTEKAAAAHGHAGSDISVSPTGDIASTNVQSALAELDNEKAPKSSSFVTTVAESGLTNEVVYGSTLSRVGLLANRGLATAFPIGSTYTATNDNGGTTYITDGTAWHVEGASASATASGDGHTIKDATTTFTQRSGLKVTGAGASITDDPAGDNTVLNIPGAGTSTLETDLANTANAALGDAKVGFKQDVTGGAARTVHQKLGDEWTVKDFGATGDGSTDDLAAFNAAISAMSSAGASRGRKLRVPWGTYRLSGPLRISRNLVLEGESGGGWNGGARLAFDAGVAGVIIERATTSADGGAGDWSVIRYLNIEAVGKTTAQHGIRLTARGSIEHCYVKGWKGDGIHIEASTPTNANSWSITHCRVDSNDGHGLFINGSDVNCGTCIGLDSETNGGWGIYDSSGLGNTYVACHTAGNGLGAYKTEEIVAKTVLLNCYSEAGQPPSQLAPRTLVIGGEHGAGFHSSSLGPLLGGTDLKEFLVERGVEVYNTTGSVAIRADLGKDDTSMTAFRAYSQDVNNDYRLRYNLGEIGRWEWTYGNLSGKIVIAMSTDAHAEGSGNLWFPQGYRIGQGLAMSRRTLGTAQPSDATGGAGDVVYNYLPQPGQPSAWIKTAEAPNHWKPLGIVDMLAYANIWSGSQRFDSPTLLKHVATPGNPAAGFSTFYARTSDGHPIIRLPDGSEFDLAALGGGGVSDHNHTGTAGDGGLLTSPLFDGIAEFVEATPPSWTGLTRAKVYSPNTGLDLFLDVAGRLRVGNNELVNDPLLDLGSGTSAQANSVRLRNLAGTFSFCIAGANDQFLVGTQNGDSAVRYSTKLLLGRPDQPWTMLLDDLISQVKRLKVGTAANVATQTDRLRVTQTWDPPSMASGDLVDLDITVTGAVLGDMVNCSWNQVLPNGVVFMKPEVVATNTVRVTMVNYTATTQNLGPGTIAVILEKYV